MAFDFPASRFLLPPPIPHLCASLHSLLPSFPGIAKGLPSHLLLLWKPPREPVTLIPVNLLTRVVVYGGPYVPVDS
jgi:hypothetical protein